MPRSRRPAAGSATPATLESSNRISWVLRPNQRATWSGNSSAAVNGRTVTRRLRPVRQRTSRRWCARCSPTDRAESSSARRSQPKQRSAGLRGRTLPRRAQTVFAAPETWRWSGIGRYRRRGEEDQLARLIEPEPGALQHPHRQSRWAGHSRVPALRCRLPHERPDRPATTNRPANPCLREIADYAGMTCRNVIG